MKDGCINFLRVFKNQSIQQFVFRAPNCHFSNWMSTAVQGLFNWHWQPAVVATQWPPRLAAGATLDLCCVGASTFRALQWEVWDGNGNWFVHPCIPAVLDPSPRTTATGTSAGTSRDFHLRSLCNLSKLISFFF